MLSGKRIIYKNFAVYLESKKCWCTTKFFVSFFFQLNISEWWTLSQNSCIWLAVKAVAITPKPYLDVHGCGCLGLWSHHFYLLMIRVIISCSLSQWIHSVNAHANNQLHAFIGSGLWHHNFSWSLKVLTLNFKPK